MFLRFLVLTAAAMGLFGCTQTPPPPEGQGGAALPALSASAGVTKDQGKHENRPMYRFDFTFASTEAGKATTTTAYTLNLEEKHSGEIRQGHNVPLQVAPPASGSAAASSSGLRPAMISPRQDVGFLLRCNFTASGEDLMLESDLEMSGVDPTPNPHGVQSIQKLVLKGNALVSPGKSSVVSSSEDPVTHQRYQLSVTATKLR